MWSHEQFHGEKLLDFSSTRILLIHLFHKSHVIPPCSRTRCQALHQSWLLLRYCTAH